MKNILTPQQVTKRLLSTFGRTLSCVEQLTDGVYRAHLTDGRMVAAFATDDGGLATKVLDNVSA